MSALLDIHGVHAGYGDVNVLWGIDMSLEQGSVTAMIGSNGAGKSTLMRVLSGLLPASQGEIRWKGKVITRCNSAELLGLGIVHVPEGRRLFSAMSIEDNLLMGAYSRKEGNRVIQRDLDRVYATFPKLHQRRNQAAGTLSGGEQQMCAIGRGLMSAPELLMIDELSLGLSPLIVEQLVEALQQLNREGLSLLVVEQDVMTALDISTTAFVVDMGRIVRHGSSEELAHDSAVREAYLGALAEQVDESDS